ncbi:hypothetical protein BLX24_09120 [Arsenicibacter rosenii]|uniref:histidine kinase n=1 Tax=Arsenicibacter rosenii TaxID=1750698 RepID=A0A1S2VL60_9BACT|nr:hypothetical protein BLX24_09120 [Arsenicibacter rosenii]
MDNLPDAIAWLVPVSDEQGEIQDFVFQYVNQKAHEVTGEGFTCEEGLLLVADNQSIAGFAETLFDQYKEVFLTGITKEYNYYNPLVKKYFYVNRKRWENGVLSITRDRTAEIDAETVAREERQRHIEQLQFVTDSSLTAIGLYGIVRDPETREVIDLRYELINQMAERMTGRKAAQLVGRTMRETFPGIEKSGIWQLYKKLAETGESIQYHNHYTFDGYDLWYQVQGVRKNEHIVLSFLDITELKRSQEEKQQQAELLNSMLTNAPIGFAQYESIRDASGTITDFKVLLMNQMVAEIINSTVEEALKTTLLTISPVLKTTGAFDKYIDVVEKDERMEVDRHFGNHWYRLSAVKFGDGFILAGIDISQSYQDQSRLETINKELRRSNESLQQFAYVASHDLQEPLRKIQSFGDLLLNQFEPQLGLTGRDLIVRMQSASARMSLLIRDLLAYSRVSTHREAFRVVNLNEIISEVLEDLDVAMRETNASVFCDPLPSLSGDAVQLRQLFQNLIANSIKFRREHTPPVIQITCQVLYAGEAPAPLNEAGGSCYEITLTDNGIGFEPRYAERIFEVFQRLHTRQNYSGTGVGLSICKKVAENHGGTIVAEGHPDEGATFRIFLPQLATQAGKPDTGYAFARNTGSTGK